MALVTMQVIEGLERGQIYADLPTPVTIGREDDNRIRLNDERVSRFHAKIQEDNGRIILTDLDSTNGTRVNGHPVQMRVLQVGDQIAIGRCLLIFGSPEEIAARAAQVEPNAPPFPSPAMPTISLSDDVPLEEGSDWLPFDDLGPSGQLFPYGSPPLPEGLRAAQQAELSDFLAFMHEQLREVVQSAVEIPPARGEEQGDMRVGWLAWQRLLALEMDLAAALRRLANPDG